MSMFFAKLNAGSNGSLTHARHISYLDCLTGKAVLPSDPIEKTIFQILMIGGMVTFMGVFNGIQHNGLNFLPHGLWMLPLVFCIGFFVRTFIANPVVAYLAPRLVSRRLSGVQRNLAMTLLNVGVMCPIMSIIITMLLNGTEGYWSALFSSLPLSALVAVLVNLFVVGPVVKMIWGNRLSHGRGIRLVDAAQKYAMPWTYFLNN